LATLLQHPNLVKAIVQIAAALPKLSEEARRQLQNLVEDPCKSLSACLSQGDCRQVPAQAGVKG